MTQKISVGTIEKVTEQAACIRLPGQRLPVWFLDEHNILLFDSGLADSHREALTQCLVQNRLYPRAILTSHAHIDHIGNHAYLKERYGAAVWMTALDAALTATPEALMLLFPNFGKRSLMKFAGDMLATCDRAIQPHEQSVCVEGQTIRVLPLPGHSPGHIGFVLPDGTAYLGDLLLSRKLLEYMRYPFGLCWATDFESKRKALQLDCTTAFVAHNEICRDVPALIAENLRFVRQRMQELADQIVPMDTLSDLIHRIYAAEDRKHSSYDLLVIDHAVRLMAGFLADVDCIRLIERSGAIHFLPTGKRVPSLRESDQGKEGRCE